MVKFYIFTTVFLLFFTINSAAATCPFSTDCNCEPGEDDHTFRTVNCTAVPTISTQYQNIRVTGEMIIVAPINNLPANTFVAFLSIKKLTLYHKGIGTERVSWDNLAFNTEINEIEIRSLDILPLPEALKTQAKTLSTLSIGSDPVTASLDLSEFGWMEQAKDLRIYNFDKLISLRYNDAVAIKWSVKSLISISLQHTSVERIDSQIGKLFTNYPLLAINVQNSFYLKCDDTVDVTWMAKYFFCTLQLTFQNAYCSYDGITHFETYLRRKTPVSFTCDDTSSTGQSTASAAVSTAVSAVSAGSTEVSAVSTAQSTLSTASVSPATKGASSVSTGVTVLSLFLSIMIAFIFG